MILFRRISGNNHAMMKITMIDAGFWYYNPLNTKKGQHQNPHFFPIPGPPARLIEVLTIQKDLLGTFFRRVIKSFSQKNSINPRSQKK
jgi:hypothetical protein